MIYILFIATMIPGSSMLLAINHGVNQGIARIIYTEIGNVLGNLLMVLVSIVGLGA
jgi:homoserine/homoserine lactone efflux protein